MRDAGERGLKNAQTVEPHGVDRMAGGAKPPCGGWLGGALTACRDAEVCTHARAQTPVLENWCAVRVRLGWEGRTIRVSPTLLLGRGMVAASKKYSMTRAWCGIAAVKDRDRVRWPSGLPKGRGQRRSCTRELC